jgi:hypothetical protein
MGGHRFRRDWAIVLAIVLPCMFAQLGLDCQIRSSFEQVTVPGIVGLNYPSKLCHTWDQGKLGAAIRISAVLQASHRLTLVHS